VLQGGSRDERRVGEGVSEVRWRSPVGASLSGRGCPAEMRGAPVEAANGGRGRRQTGRDRTRSGGVDSKGARGRSPHRRRGPVGAMALSWCVRWGIVVGRRRRGGETTRIREMELTGRVPCRGEVRERETAADTWALAPRVGCVAGGGPG
jgi:hypothetical protein